MKANLDDTIVAVSTPIGEGGIGIVRLSGKDSLKIADEIFLSKDGKRPSRFKTYTVHYGYIVERTENRVPLDNARSRQRTDAKKPKVVDEVILTVMRAPKSYTREDIVEINCHSGIVPLKKILDLTLKHGGRLGEPGEFTKRAFLNGRIDIIQAESVLDIVRAKTELSLRAALNNLEGLLSKKLNAIRDELLEIYSYMEAGIDFSEEDMDPLKKKETFQRLIKVRKDLETLIAGSDKGRILRQGIRVVICGSPNVGKSSLMNALLKESRSIVTHLPGTTRDTIEEMVNIKGIPALLIDTAGITDSSHPVEIEGIKRSHISLKMADLILLVIDNSRKLTKDDIKIIEHVKNSHKEVMVVINKSDLKKDLDIKRIKGLLPGKSILHVSSLYLKGIDQLEHKIKDMMWKGSIKAPDFTSISNERQLEMAQKALCDIDNVIHSWQEKRPVDYISLYIRSSIENLGHITGHTITEEALDRIFSEFCIGK